MYIFVNCSVLYDLSQNQIYLYLKLKHSSAVWKKDTKHFTDASIRNHITTNIAGHISSQLQLMAIDWKLFLHHSVVFLPPLHINVHVCVSLCRGDYDHCRVPRKRERQLKCEYFIKSSQKVGVGVFRHAKSKSGTFLTKSFYQRVQTTCWS